MRVYALLSFECVVADVPIAMIPSTGEISLLQMDGPISKQELLKAISLAKPVLERIVKIQREALKDYYKSV